MSDWILLGEFEPDYEWLSVEPIIVGATTIKIQHDWAYASAFPGKAHITLAQKFPDGSFNGFRKSFPYRDPRLLTFLIPDPLDLQGWDNYELVLKKNLWARYQADADWRVTVWRWPGLFDYSLDPGEYEEFPDVSDDPLFDGGAYQL